MRTIALAALTLLFACAPKKNTPINEIPQLKTLEEVMDNQSTTADPQFAKMNNASFTDAELADLTNAAARLQATSLKVKEFANGRTEFDAFAGQLNEKSKALATAASAKDPAGVRAALADMKAACKGCHAKFR
jgi:cytochrome c556